MTTAPSKRDGGPANPIDGFSCAESREEKEQEKRGNGECYEGRLKVELPSRDLSTPWHSNE